MNYFLYMCFINHVLGFITYVIAGLIPCNAISYSTALAFGITSFEYLIIYLVNKYYEIHLLNNT